MFSVEYKVVLLSRTQEKLDGLANEIKESGGEVIPFSHVVDVIGCGYRHRFDERREYGRGIALCTWNVIAGISQD